MFFISVFVSLNSLFNNMIILLKKNYEINGAFVTKCRFFPVIFSKIIILPLDKFISKKEILYVAFLASILIANILFFS